MMPQDALEIWMCGRSPPTLVPMSAIDAVDGSSTRHASAMPIARLRNHPLESAAEATVPLSRRVSNKALVGQSGECCRMASPLKFVRKRTI